MSTTKQPQEKTSCRHIEKACRHMWRMATVLDNAALNRQSQKMLIDVLVFKIVIHIAVNKIF